MFGAIVAYLIKKAPDIRRGQALGWHFAHPDLCEGFLPSPYPWKFQGRGRTRLDFSTHPRQENIYKTPPQPALAAYKSSSQRVRREVSVLPRRVRQGKHFLALSLRESPVPHIHWHICRFPYVILPREADHCVSLSHFPDRLRPLISWAPAPCAATMFTSSHDKAGLDTLIRLMVGAKLF